MRGSAWDHGSEGSPAVPRHPATASDALVRHPAEALRLRGGVVLVDGVLVDGVLAGGVLADEAPRTAPRANAAAHAA